MCFNADIRINVKRSIETQRKKHTLLNNDVNEIYPEQCLEVVDIKHEHDCTNNFSPAANDIQDIETECSIIHVEVPDLKHRNDVENDSNVSESSVLNIRSCNSKPNSANNSDNQLSKEDINKAEFVEENYSEDCIKINTQKVTQQKIQKSSESLYNCYKCNVSYKTPQEFKDHQIEHAKIPRLERNICTVCNKSFSYRHLKLHMRTHTKEKPYQCSNCKMRFSFKANFKRHMMTHTGERPHKCELCGKGNIKQTVY